MHKLSQEKKLVSYLRGWKKLNLKKEVENLSFFKLFKEKAIVCLSSISQLKIGFLIQSLGRIDSRENSEIEILKNQSQSLLSIRQFWHLRENN